MTNPVVELVPVGALTPNPDNPRTITDERFDALKRSLSASPDHFYARPIIARRDGVIAGGNMRLRAAQALGLTEVPVVYLDLDDEAFALLTLRDNNEYGSWDDQLLAESLWHLSQTDVDLTLAGFDDDELQRLLDSVSGLDTPGGDPDDVPGLPVEAETQPGELIELGDHRLYCGDATLPESYERLLGGDRAELLFTSPPYGDQRTYNDTTVNLEPAHVAKFLEASAAHTDLMGVVLGLQWRDGAIDPYWDHYTAAAGAIGLKLLSWNVWDKGFAGSIGAANGMFECSHEWILVFGGAPMKIRRTRPNKHAGRKASRTVRQQDGSTGQHETLAIASHGKLRTVLQVTPDMNSGADHAVHSARFPVQLPEEMISACSKRGAVILDPFAGSGTTLIAAERLGRKARVMEIDPRYCDVIRKRYADYTAT